jgi:GDPmannose 4,6-dehydratase
VTYRLKELNIYEQVKFEVVDLRQKNTLDSLVKEYKPSYFAHLASQSSVKKSQDFKKLTEESNYLISKNVIESLEKYSKDTIFFFPSSANIYEGYQNTTVDEHTLPLPLTNYAISKYKIQNLISKKNNLQLNTGILFSHESEFRRPNFFSKRIADFLVRYYLGDKKCLSVGDLSIGRDIGYAEEYVEAIYQILKQNRKVEYIVSSNHLYQLSDIVENILELLDIKYETLIKDNMLSYIDLKTNNKFIVSDIKNFRTQDLIGIKGDNNKIKQDLNWTPKIKLDEICERMINYELNKY